MMTPATFYYICNIIEYTLQLKFVVQGENQAPHSNQPKVHFVPWQRGLDLKCPLFGVIHRHPLIINPGYGVCRRQQETL